MGILEKVSGYMDALLVVTGIIVVGCFFLYYYLFKIKKITAKEEKINYSNFNKLDSTEYMKFANIISEKVNVETGKMSGMGIVDIGNGTYVGGIDIIGYNFGAASIAERQNTMINAIGLANIIDRPIQFRQSCRAVQLQDNITEYSERLENLKFRLIELDEEYKSNDKNIKDMMGGDDTYLEAAIEKQERLMNEIKSKRWQVMECTLMIKFMESRSDRNRDAQRMNQIMFSYTFDSKEFTEEMTKAEIDMKALEELRATAYSYKNAIENCGCNVSLLTGEDFVMLLKRHMAPFTADDFTCEELFNSSYGELFVSSDSLRESEIQRRSEEEYKKYIAELEARQREALRLQNVELERNNKQLRRKLESM